MKKPIVKKPIVSFIRYVPGHFHLHFQTHDYVPSQWDAMVGDYCDGRILASGETLAQCVEAARGLGGYVCRMVINNALNAK